MTDDYKRERALIYKHLNLFNQNRIDYYTKRDKWITLDDILSKDILMFAARGVWTSEDFVREAFHAKESSSEETVMGNTWQAFIGEMADNAIDTGDLTAERDGAIWLCELKSQKNTVNSASFPQEIRDLKRKVEIQNRYRRARKQPIRAAYCILRSNKSVDEMRVYHPTDDISANRDIDGFEYRWLEGKAFWLWLADVDEPAGLIEDASPIKVHNIVELRERSIQRVTKDMNDALDEHGLSHDINGILELKRIRSRKK